MTVVITSIRKTFDGVIYFCYLNTSPNKCQLLIAKHPFSKRACYSLLNVNKIKNTQKLFSKKSTLIGIMKIDFFLDNTNRKQRKSSGNFSGQINPLHDDDSTLRGVVSVRARAGSNNAEYLRFYSHLIFRLGGQNKS